MVKQAWVQIQLFELEYNNKIVYENVYAGICSVRLCIKGSEVNNGLKA